MLETLALPIITELLTLGGGYVIAAAFFLLYLYERKDKKELAKDHVQEKKDLVDSKDKLYDRLFMISDRQTETLTKVGSVLEHNDKVLDNVNGTLQSLLIDRRHQ